MITLNCGVALVLGGWFTMLVPLGAREKVERMYHRQAVDSLARATILARANCRIAPAKVPRVLSITSSRDDSREGKYTWSSSIARLVSAPRITVSRRARALPICLVHRTKAHRKNPRGAKPAMLMTMSLRSRLARSKPEKPRTVLCKTEK